jgi:hypothetical protein
MEPGALSPSIAVHVIFVSLPKPLPAEPEARDVQDGRIDHSLMAIKGVP